MSLSDNQLPLSYCTNVHPGRSVAEVMDGLTRYAVEVQKNLIDPIAVGLWLARPVIDELLATADGARRLSDWLRQRNLPCHTLNAFPFGDFHGARVKEKVYLPDWTDASRLKYTLDCAHVLSQLLDPGVEGSISTLPLGFKPFERPADFLDRSAANLIDAARGLDQLRQATGRMIRLAIEPEPLCVLETTPEAIDFFRRLLTRADDANALDAVRAHIGLCYDVCHQAVEFEDAAASILALDGADIRLNKVHISCALQLDRPASNREGREALARYVEPRYLHQTTARLGDGKLARETDLSAEFIAHPPPAFAEAPMWRIHFHVPVNQHHLGPLSTTRAELVMALTALAELDYQPHLEIETYTWEVLPDKAETDLVTGLTREMVSSQKLLSELKNGNAK